MSKTYNSFFKEAKDEIDKAKKMKMEEASILIRNATVKKLTGGGSGRSYRVPGTNIFYTASSPGQPPAVMVGDLRQSIQWKFEGDTAYVGSELEKSKHLEFGTKNMSARPFLKPAFEEEVDNIARILGKDWLK